MDLSFAHVRRDRAVTALPTELAVLMVGVAARQAASPTARAQARIEQARGVAPLLAPADGSFDSQAAGMLAARSQE